MRAREDDEREGIAEEADKNDHWGAVHHDEGGDDGEGTAPARQPVHGPAQGRVGRVREDRHGEVLAETL